MQEGMATFFITPPLEVISNVFFCSAESGERSFSELGDTPTPAKGSWSHTEGYVSTDTLDFPPLWK
jgi:hypothetical protein